MRTFEITWYKNDRNPIERKSKVTVTQQTRGIERDAKVALEIFLAEFGNLKKNTVVSIAELDKDGNQVGELIKPTEGSSIIPTRR